MANELSTVRRSIELLGSFEIKNITYLQCEDPQKYVNQVEPDQSKNIFFRQTNFQEHNWKIASSFFSELQRK